MIQTVFSSNDAVFKDANNPIHTAEAVQSSFEEHAGGLKLLPWSANTRFYYHLTTLVSFGDESEEQIPTSSISRAT
jgi:hypothetical protein